MDEDRERRLGIRGGTERLTPTTECAAPPTAARLARAVRLWRVASFWPVAIPLTLWLSHFVVARGSNAQLAVVFGLDVVLVALVLLLRWGLDRTASMLARCGDPQAVGALAEFVRGRCRGWDQAAGVLTELLPLMTPEQCLSLTPYHRASLRRLLVESERVGRPAGWQKKLKLAILQSLQQCAVEEDRSAVAYLAKRARDASVRAAARQCFENLEARLEEERPTAKLLRPADAPEGATLLRPAQPAQETPEEQLLRPASRDEEGYGN